VASGIGAVVAGGGYDGVVSGNQASGNASVVSGGDVNVASGLEATVGGGEYNTASGPFATVSGGNVNTASGEQATVPGGYRNVASGQYSFAAGNNAQANNFGAFVWSDGSGTLTQSSTNNQFVARASGGFVLYSSTSASGVSLAAGSGSWSSLSDRAAKEGVASVSSQAVLDKVVALPLSTWSYKTEPGVRHVGPMAQDFYAAFRVGEDERHIAEVDEGGVALAAIQGLNQRFGEQASTQAAELKEKDAQIRALEQRLEHLENVLSELSNRH
jgi:hypothetical protein